MATTLETTFAVTFANLVMGRGATREVGDHVADLGLRRVLLVTDPRLRELPPVGVALESLRRCGVDVDVFDGVEVEPTDTTFEAAGEAAAAGAYDGFVAVGGGSVIDTAKAANLLATHPAPLLDYVNKPIGAGKPPPGPLRPLVAVPTTAGTGSETTGVAILDRRALHAKTGIAHRFLRPTLGIVDPDNTRSLPPMVAASSGFDVLSHALESYTAIPFDSRPAPERPSLRPSYQGANPFSDVWARRAIEMVAQALPRVVDDSSDDEARELMALAATYAGIGFGNAGVHLPHGMSYAVSGMVRSFVPAGYPPGKALIPHGMSVILNAPAVFRWTASASTDRHLDAAALLGADIRGAAPEDAGTVLAGRLQELMRRTGVPVGLEAVGYTAADAPALAEATLPQERVTKLAPRIADRATLEQLFRDAMPASPA
jgi:hydroxyacid-oxoacid transhydrogenase